MDDENLKKKTKRSLIDTLRIISPLIERFLTYYYVSIPLVIALLLLGLIDLFEKSGIHSTLTDPPFKIGLYFAIMGFVITLALLIQSDIKITRLEKEIKRIKEFVNFKNENQIESKPKSTGNRVKLNSPGFLFLVFLICLALGLFLYWAPNQIPDRVGAQTWEGISLTHNDGFNFTMFDFNFVTIPDNRQYLFIDYSIDTQIKNGTHYALLILPYVGKLESMSENGWTQYNVSSSHTSILYKEFPCATDYSFKCYVVNNPNLYFDLQDDVDTKQYYVHSINIPFAPMLQPDTVSEVDKILKGKVFRQGWNVKNPPNIRVTVNDTVTQLNPIPDGYMTSFKVQPRNVSASVFQWSLPKHDITFHLDYTNPGERRSFDDQRNVSLILFGTAISFLVVATSEYLRKPKN